MFDATDRDFYFWNGLPRDIRKAISRKLAASDASYHARLIPSWKDAIQAGRTIFRDLTVSFSYLQSDSLVSKYFQVLSPAPDDSVNNLIRTLQALRVEDPNYAVAYARLLLVAPVVADRVAPPYRWSYPYNTRPASPAWSPHQPTYPTPPPPPPPCYPGSFSVDGFYGGYVAH